jgi:hypothetical protein
MVLEDIPKVVVDYEHAPYRKRKEVDTGRFELLYKAKFQVEQPKVLNLNLTIEGKKAN